MFSLRKALIYIRQKYDSQPRELFFRYGIILLISMVIAVCLDIFLPFRGVWTIVRSMMLIPLSASMFVISYAVSLYLHNNKMTTDKTWVPYRLRWSLRWRQRIALILGSIVFVMMYSISISQSPITTIMASIMIVLILSLIAFIRPTYDENLLDQMHLPDSRDIRSQQFLEKLVKEQNNKKGKKNDRKK